MTGYSELFQFPYNRAGVSVQWTREKGPQSDWRLVKTVIDMVSVFRVNEDGDEFRITNFDVAADLATHHGWCFGNFSDYQKERQQWEIARGRDRQIKNQEI